MLPQPRRCHLHATLCEWAVGESVRALGDAIDFTGLACYTESPLEPSGGMRHVFFSRQEEMLVAGCVSPNAVLPDYLPVRGVGACVASGVIRVPSEEPDP
jgi:hypothetical protein